MKRTQWLVPLLLVLLPACAWWMAGRPGQGVSDRLTFSHSFHAEEDIECDACHGEVAEAEDLSRSFLPLEEACMECHDKEPGECEMCHSNVELRRSRTPHEAQINISHAKHIERVEGDCATCHVGVAEAETVPFSQMTMDTCTACHNHMRDYEEARCLGCHPTLRDLPLKAIAHMDHKEDWEQRHGMLARSSGAQCEQCHKQTMCTECHARLPAGMPVTLKPELVGKSQLHRGDWLSVHQLEARVDGDTCLRCHQTNYCESCHSLYGLAPGAVSPRVPHPPGWATPGLPFHGSEARLRITKCATCHDQGPASICVNCHKVGAIGGNPHPEFWTDRWTPADRQSDPRCWPCHAGR